MSSLISIITACSLVVVPSALSEFLYQNYESAKDDKSFINAHGSYINGFRVKANILILMYYPIFMFRRLCYSAIIVFLSEYPYVQLALISICNIAVLFQFFINISLYSTCHIGSHSRASIASSRRFVQRSILQFSRELHSRLLSKLKNLRIRLLAGS